MEARTAVGRIYPRLIIDAKVKSAAVLDGGRRTTIFYAQHLPLPYPRQKGDVSISTIMLSQWGLRLRLLFTWRCTGMCHVTLM